MLSNKELKDFKKGLLDILEEYNKVIKNCKYFPYKELMIYRNNLAIRLLKDKKIVYSNKK